MRHSRLMYGFVKEPLASRLSDNRRGIEDTISFECLYNSNHLSDMDIPASTRLRLLSLTFQAHHHRHSKHQHAYRILSMP